MNFRQPTQGKMNAVNKLYLISICTVLCGFVVFATFFSHSAVSGSPAACGAFPVNVAIETELNDAIDCFNTKTLAGSYDINLTADINLSASSSAINNTSSGAILTINGNDFTIDGQDIEDVRPIAIYTDSVVAINDLIVTGGHANTIPDVPKVLSNGGGIQNFGTLTLSNTVVISNIVADGGGGIFSAEDATLILRNSRVEGNISEEIKKKEEK